jgi:hypothetical protein
MAFVPHEINLLVTSDPASGAINVSPDGSSFEIQLENAIKIPDEAINATISVEEATVWWSIPNVVTGVNDKLYCTVPRATDDLLTAYIITIPSGLYDLTGLNNSISRGLENAGAKMDGGLASITYSPDNATQKVEMRLAYLGSTVSFVQADTFKDLLGYDAQVIGPTIVEPVTFLAENTAGFNTVNYFLIHSDLVSKGIRFNNSYNQSIAQVLIDVAPGSQIVSKPYNPARTNASQLIGDQRKNLKFWLTDDSNRAVNMSGEFWTARVVLKFLLPHVFKHGDGRII